MPETRLQRPRFCSQCGSAVTVADARFCKECGAPLPSAVWLNQSMSWRPLIALILSVLPGLGHWYKGQPLRGLLWFCAVILFYSLSLPFTVLIHLICAFNAALGGAIHEDVLLRRARFRRRSGSVAIGAGRVR